MLTHYSRGHLFKRRFGDLNLVEVYKFQIKSIGKRLNDRNLIHNSHINEDLTEALALALLLGRQGRLHLRLTDGSLFNQHLTEAQAAASLRTDLTRSIGIRIGRCLG